MQLDIGEVASHCNCCLPLSSCCCHLTSVVVVIVVVARLQFDEMPHINIEMNANYKYLIDDPTPALGTGSEGERGKRKSKITQGKFSY